MIIMMTITRYADTVLKLALPTMLPLAHIGMVRSEAA